MLDSVLKYMAPIFAWLSSGPVGIIAGIFGLGGILTGLIIVMKKMKEAQFQGSLNDNSRIAGDVSQEITANMQRNTTTIDALAAQEQARLKAAQTPKVPQPPTPPLPDSAYIQIIAPRSVKVGERFIVALSGFDTTKTYMLCADKKWKLGLFSVEVFDLEVVLTGAGERTLDIEISGDGSWVSVPITVRSE